MPANLENSAKARGLAKVSFIRIPKKGNAKECGNCHTVSLIPHDSMVMLKILQARLHRCSRWILKRQRNQRSNCQHLLDHTKSKRIQKNIYFCFIDCAKTFDCVGHKKLWKLFLEEMGILGNLTCLLWNLYASQEATVRTKHRTKEWFQIRMEYVKAIYCHPEYLTYMQSTSWEIPSQMNHKLESRFPGEISVTSDMQLPLH